MLKEKMTGCFPLSSSLVMPGELSLGTPKPFDLEQSKFTNCMIPASFDEPNLKATYDLSITIPENFTALSNQPVKESKSMGDGLKKVSFERVPKMSTYVCLHESPSPRITNKI